MDKIYKKMKKVLILLITLVAFTSCKKESKQETHEAKTIENIDGPEKTAKQSDGLTLLKGEFVYYADAAVLQTHNQIYGVILNDMVDELNSKAKPFKTEPTDFVNIEIRGKITPKPKGTEGWDNRVEIKEILNVSASKSENDKVVKLGSE